MKRIHSLLVSLVLAAPAVAAADPLPKEVLDMDCILGSWKGDGTVVMGKDKAKINATWNCSRTSGGFGVTCAFRVTGIPGMAAYEETDLFGYEPNSGTYHWYSVTNAAETHDHVAKPSANGKIEFVYTGTQEGKPFREVIELDIAEKSMSGKAETFAGGVSTSVMKLKFVK